MPEEKLQAKLWAVMSIIDETDIDLTLHHTFKRAEDYAQRFRKQNTNRHEDWVCVKTRDGLYFLRIKSDPIQIKPDEYTGVLVIKNLDGYPIL